MRRLREALRFSAPKGQPIEVSGQAYLAVLAARQPLPSLLQVVAPKGEGGAVPGFGVPASAGATAPGQPLERGEYGIANMERKSVLRLRVLSKEEAGFVPSPATVAQIGEQFGTEVARRVAAAWSLLQLTWETYDPDVHTALDFWLAVARRLATLTDGVVSDPVAHTYRLPEDDSGRPAEAAVWAPQHIGLQINSGHIHTLGMSKFVRPELEATGVPPDGAHEAGALLMGVAQACLEGQRPTPGDSLQAGRGTVKIAEGGLDREYWQGKFVLEVLPDSPSDWAHFLSTWRAKN